MKTAAGGFVRTALGAGMLLFCSVLQGLSQEADFKPRFGVLEQPPEDLHLYEQRQKELEAEGTPEGPRLIPTYFTRFRPDIRRFCDAITKDGRREEFYSMVSPFTLRDDQCPACMPFFKEWSNACRPKEARVRAGSTPAPEIVRQREMSLESVDAVTRAFSRIAQERDYLPLIMPAVEKLLSLMRSADGKSSGAQEYFAAMAEYAAAPLLPYQRARDAQSRRLKPESAEAGTVRSKEALDSLFDFR